MIRVILFFLLLFNLAHAGVDLDESLEEVSNIINKKYVGKLDEAKVAEGTLKGMLESLDPYSTYMNPEEYRDFMTNASGEFGGIGVEMQKKAGDSFVTVVSAIKESPAYYAGIESGDIITHIDNESIADKSLVYIAKKIRGKAGTKVKITFVKIDTRITNDVVLTRSEIKKDSVSSKVIDKNIGYIDINMFNANTYENFLRELRKLYSNNINALIIDLRNNPGGLVESAVDIANLFVEKGSEIVTVKGKNNEVIYDYKGTNAKSNFNTIPIAILINKGSASSSEILAAALQENGIATTVGQKSYGKAAVQEVIEITSIPDSAIKMTIALYYTPKGNLIDKIGIVPDIEVVDEVSKSHDNILDHTLKVIKRANRF